MDLVSSSQQPNKNANTRRKERMERMAEYLKAQNREKEAQNREKEAQNHAREILTRLAEEEKMKREKIDHIDPKTQRNLERLAIKVVNGSSGGGASRKRKGRKTRKASRKTARKMRR